jgi:hypothetical protein
MKCLNCSSKLKIKTNKFCSMDCYRAYREERSKHNIYKTTKETPDFFWDLKGIYKNL